MGITHWSKDSRYVYFYSTIGGSCGECFYEGYDVGAGLFRLDLFTGQTSEVLPPNTVFYWYCFSIAPTGRFLVYSEVFHNLKILDMNTGQTINVVHKKDFRNRGRYVWSPDGLRFVFSSVSYNLEEAEREGYSLHLVDAQTGEERILLESKTSCYLVKEWRENNVLVVEYNDENYARAIMEYDLNTDSFLGNPPPSSP